MLDLRLIKKNQLEESVKKRGINFNVNELYDIYEKYQDLKGKIEELNYKCNINSSLKNKEEGKKIKELKKYG